MVKKIIVKLLIKYYTNKINSFQKLKQKYIQKNLHKHNFDINVIKKYEKIIALYKERIEELKY